MITKAYFGEGKHIEFKQQLPKNREHILKDIIAFSNTSGESRYWVSRMKLE